MKITRFQKLLGYIILIDSLFFFPTTICIIICLIVGDNVYDYLKTEEGNSMLGVYKAAFWVLLVSIILFFASGGTFKDLKEINRTG